MTDHQSHQSPYPVANGAAVAVRLDHLEGRMRTVERDTEPVPVLAERVSSLTQEVMALRQTVAWLTRAVLGASGIGAVVVGALIQIIRGG